jgi:hypothetical protein
MVMLTLPRYARATVGTVADTAAESNAATPRKLVERRMLASKW